MAGIDILLAQGRFGKASDGTMVAFVSGFALKRGNFQWLYLRMGNSQKWALKSIRKNAHGYSRKAKRADQLAQDGGDYTLAYPLYGLHISEPEH